MSDKPENLCSTGDSALFPEVKQCSTPATVYMFGDPYCKACYDKLVALHALINSSK
jgi:hypothetical protein